VEIVDAVSAAVAQRDAGRLLELIHFYRRSCTDQLGIGAIPCPPEQAVGSPVTVIGSGACEGSFSAIDSQYPPQIAANFVATGPYQVDSRIYAIARQPPFIGEDIPGDYLIVFASAHALAVDSAGITYFLFPCGQSPRERVDPRRGFLLWPAVPLDPATWRNGTVQCPMPPAVIVPPKGVEMGDAKQGLCVVWANDYSDESGFRVSVRYEGGELFSHSIPANEHDFVFPAAEAPVLTGPDCVKRRSFTIEVVVLRPSGEEPVGASSVVAECRPR